MARSKSWSVKGIAPDVRDTARDAAQSAGLPIGAWIDNAILKASRGELPDIGVVAAGPAPTAETTAPSVMGTTDDSAGTAPDTEALPTAPAADSPADPTPDEPVRTPPEFVVLPGGAPAQTPTPETTLFQRIDADENGIGPSGLQPGERAIEMPVRRPGLVRYLAVAVVLLALAGVAGWFVLELSTPDRRPTTPTVADATPAPVTPAPASPTTPAAVENSSRNPVATPATVPMANIPAELARAATSGSATAQYDLGMLYLAGKTVPKSAAEAAKWFEKAAMQGLAKAQFNLGVLYQKGDGLPADQQLAFFWYQSAAEQNFPRAEHNLATAYADGRGVPRNEPKAIEWFTKAAKNGVAESQHSLGLIFERGYGTVKADLSAAKTWYASAATQGYSPSVDRLAAIEKQLAAAQPAKAPDAVPAAPKTVAADRPLSRAEIRDLQRLLNTLNFDAGPADGQMGKRTNAAISLYQKFAGFPETGKASRPLLDDLQAIAKTMSPTP